MKTRLDLDAIRSKPWGERFLREMELVVAQSEVEARKTGRTLYNPVLNQRVADFVLPLDAEYDERFLGVIEIPPNDEAPYKRDEIIADTLKDAPRGTWAIFEKDGRYEGIMANGAGGYAHQSGHSFTTTSPIGFDARTLYACTLSAAVYEMRNKIDHEIDTYSAAQAGIVPGTKARDVRLGGKQFGTVTYLEERPDHFVGGSSAYRVEGRRRGAKPSIFDLDPRSFMHIFQIDPALPPRLKTDDAVDRSRSMQELRQDVAQRTWDDFIEHEAPDVSRRGSKAPFTVDGDTYTREVLAAVDDHLVPAGTYRVHFQAGTTTVASASLEWRDSPTTGPRP